MASDEHHPHIYNDDDLDGDDDDDTEPLNAAVDSSSSATDEACDGDGDGDGDATSTAAVPASSITPAHASTAVTIALPDPKRHRFDSTSAIVVATEKKPIEDSKRLFQRLWTDEDEIELLQGFLHYTANRGTTSSGYHHDTAAFYDMIKSKLQLDFNKNQLVEKLRRLKKKYRNVLSKMVSGKEFVFKSPHDQATFEISRKIWSNFPGNNRLPAEIDDDDHNPNPNPKLMNTALAATTPNNSYIISHINLNNAANANATAMALDHHLKAGSSISNALNVDMMISNLNNAASLGKLSSRKRPRSGKIEEKFVRNVNLGLGGSGTGNSDRLKVNVDDDDDDDDNNNSNIAGSSMQGLIEETLKSCLSPLLKELIGNAVNGSALGGGCGVKGFRALAMNTMPLNFSGINFGGSGDVVDEKWRKQQILELEVYSKRLELVQDQIKSTLEELRSMGN